MTPPAPESEIEVLDPDLLRPSSALLSAWSALAAAIDHHAVTGTGQDPTTVDLLLRLELSSERRLRAVELCRALQLSPSHVSRTLDRAEAAGLVARRPDPGDRRASLVAITETGRAVVEHFGPRLSALLNRVIFDSLSPDEIEALVTYLGRIEVAARKYPSSHVGEKGDR